MEMLGPSSGKTRMMADAVMAICPCIVDPASHGITQPTPRIDQKNEKGSSRSRIRGRKSFEGDRFWNWRGRLLAHSRSTWPGGRCGTVQRVLGLAWRSGPLPRKRPGGCLGRKDIWLRGRWCMGGTAVTKDSARGRHKRGGRRPISRRPVSYRFPASFCEIRNQPAGCGV